MSQGTGSISAPAAGNTVQSLTPIPATAIAAEANSSNLTSIVEKGVDNIGNKLSEFVKSHIENPIENFIHPAIAHVTESVTTPVLKGGILQDVTKVVGPTVDEVKAFDAKFEAAAKAHVAEAGEEVETVEYAAKADLDDLINRINIFNTKSGQKI